MSFAKRDIGKKKEERESVVESLTQNLLVNSPMSVFDTIRNNSGDTGLTSQRNLFYLNFSLVSEDPFCRGDTTFPLSWKRQYSL